MKSAQCSPYLATTFANRLDCNHSLARLRIRLFRTGYNRETGSTHLGDAETAPIMELLDLIELCSGHITWVDHVTDTAGESYHELQ